MLTTLLTVAIVIALPFAALVAILTLADRRERARQRALQRQVAVTDAMHREFGALLAPVVRRRAGGRWQLRMAVPLEEPAVVGTALAIAHRTLTAAEPCGRIDDVEMVLVPQEPAPSRPRATAGSWR